MNSFLLENQISNGVKYYSEKIEKKWQAVWEKKKLYRVKDSAKGKKNFYHLVMFPYPSGNLHIGHWYNFAPADVFARMMRRQGFNVLSPIGFDAFGLPAENAALKRGIHPEKWTMQNIKTMTKQLRSMGNSYDWTREVITCLPEYYRWNQWIFLQLFKKGLAYRTKAAANWCPKDKTVLANEQVVEGRCERCGSEVEQREIDQWLFKITKYAEELLKDLDSLDWPESTKVRQRNWIGKSEGAEIDFKVKDFSANIKVFTTRPDTLFGATYVVLAPEHPLIQKLESRIQNLEEVRKYVETAKNKSDLERQENKEKTGVELMGVKAVNPANNEELPIFVADYVLGNVGTGAIMAVPAHDERDFAFAKKYDLPMRMVICPHYPATTCPVLDEAYTGAGHLVDSGKFDGMKSEDAKQVITEFVGGRKKTQYHLRDWLISRQRYWGTPIPIIYCKKCGTVPVPEKDLPIKLPPLKDFKPADDGRSPLARNKKFLHTKCPECGGSAERETDTMDTFVDSSWYFIRYADPKNKKTFADAKKIKAWLPVTMYVGGAEHTVLHLLYSRFFTKFLQSEGLLDFVEPFLALRHQGIILGPDGYKMSKSRGNVVDPDALVKQYGADTVRLYLCFMGQYDQGGPWNPGGINGISRFLNRVWKLFEQMPQKDIQPAKSVKETNDDLYLLHTTVKKVTDDIESFHFNTAISQLMVLLSRIEENRSLVMADVFLRLLAPFAPHITEEIWSQWASGKERKKSIHDSLWPEAEKRHLAQKTFELIIQINGTMRSKINLPNGVSQKDAEDAVRRDEASQKYLSGKTPKKIIFVPNRLINFVI